MKVCAKHIKTSGLPKRYLTIVESTECVLCGLNQYFNKPNPYRKTQHEIIQMYKERRKK